MREPNDFKQLGLSVSRETTDKLALFGERLLHWSGRINLVSDTSRSELWRRHILDSAQIFAFRQADTSRWSDIGSGGGLPGMVIAILASELAPEQDTWLIESDRRKASFLRVVAQDVGVNAKLIIERAELAPPSGAQTVSARALAPLNKLLGYVHRHMSQDGIALLPKGRNVQSELEVALESWDFALDIKPSMIEAEASILCISKLKRKTGIP